MWVGPAHAHEGVLAGERPIISSSDGTLLGGGTTYGLTLAAGESWQRVCEEASPGRASFFAPLGDGRVLIGTADGAFITDDGGCSYSEVSGLEGQYVSALVRRSDGSVVVSTATAGGGNGVFVSADGLAFAPGAIADEDALFFTLVARADEMWAVGTVPGASSVLFRSLDEGATFEAITPTVELDLVALSARGFDDDGALVLSGLRQGEGFVLLRTDDAFASVSEIASFSAEITAFAAFGGHRFVVVNSSGLSRQEDATGDFVEVDEGPGRCLFVDADHATLWSCGREDDGALFYSSEDGETWTAVLDPERIEDRVCPSGTPGAEHCAVPVEGVDAGALADGGDDGDAGTCRCVDATERSPLAGAGAWALLMAVVTMSGRRGRKSGRL